MKPIKVLFICMGNICRSPAAESVFADMVRRRGLETLVEVDSAGTLDYHAGSRPDPRSTKALTRRGYHTAHRARQVQSADMIEFDYLVVMDDRNRRDLQAILGSKLQESKVSQLLDWWPDAPRTDVPDPYYGDDRDFEFMMDLLEKACPALLDHIVQSHSLSRS